MKKHTAIRLLRTQLQNIHNEDIKRDEWLISTTTVLLRVFPLSADKKIGQLEQIENNPGYFEDLPAQKRIAARKEKAERFLNNYIEEIEVMGTENTGSKLELFFGSFRFWMILSSICILSFIAGTTSTTPLADTGNFDRNSLKIYEDMEKQLHLKQNTIDSLSYELEKLRLRS
ncbi:hypothetical protein FHG64_10960 [Antarcticibacterium flavum]|uniref:Uncharacterized protein n=1 Tax=Antarcticibacterium flavum TaxID=2058175 RepID=A0A5B7X3A3_9FLAO|nr:MULTISPECIES: hypothetical protein [Antarcticibacterium]MCM4159488.1 hypothetical protein [Antarcticibacterium sp. W02-3]QCY69877.1 hypothetical protein FHG64_10960 [Antarcticibacterium flavum]